MIKTGRADLEESVLLMMAKTAITRTVAKKIVAEFIEEISIVWVRYIY